MRRIINYVRKYYIEVTIFVFVAIFFLFAKDIPYINLLIDPVWYGVVLIIFASVLLHLSPKKLIVFAIIFLLFSIPWDLVGSRFATENLGVYCFTFLTVAIFKELNALRKK